MLCTWRLTVSMVNDADGAMNVKLTVKIVNYEVNRQSLVTVTSLITIVIYGAIFKWRRMCTTLITTESCLIILSISYMIKKSSSLKNAWCLKLSNRVNGTHCACTHKMRADKPAEEPLWWPFAWAYQHNPMQTFQHDAKLRCARTVDV